MWDKDGYRGFFCLLGIGNYFIKLFFFVSDVLVILFFYWGEILSLFYLDFEVNIVGIERVGLCFFFLV